MLELQIMLNLADELIISSKIDLLWGSHDFRVGRWMTEVLVLVDRIENHYCIHLYQCVICICNY